MALDITYLPHMGPFCLSRSGNSRMPALATQHHEAMPWLMPQVKQPAFLRAEFPSWRDNCQDRARTPPCTGTSPLASPTTRKWPSMPDAETLTFALTYTGTLVVAALMFLGQLAAFTVLLALAGIVRLLTLPVHALTRRERPASTER